MHRKEDLVILYCYALKKIQRNGTWLSSVMWCLNTVRIRPFLSLNVKFVICEQELFGIIPLINYALCCLLFIQVSGWLKYNALMCNNKWIHVQLCDNYDEKMIFNGKWWESWTYTISIMQLSVVRTSFSIYYMITALAWTPFTYSIGEIVTFYSVVLSLFRSLDILIKTNQRPFASVKVN